MFLRKINKNLTKWNFLYTNKAKNVTTEENKI